MPKTTKNTLTGKPDSPQMKKFKESKKVDHAADALAKLLEMFESGDVGENVARTVIRKQNNHRPSDVWSISNQMLMLLAGTEDARGYRQWEKVGRTVNKGAKAFYILAPLTRKIKEDNGTEKVIMFGFKGVPVFRVEDTTGEPVVTPEYQPVEMPPLMDVAQRFGVDVSYAPFVGDAYGAYYPGLDRITLYTQDEGVFFHELAHAAHARVEKLVGGQNPRQEIVAETVASVLCVMYGFECNGYLGQAKAYIEMYAQGKGALQAVTGVLKTVEKVLAEILGTEV